MLLNKHFKIYIRYLSYSTVLPRCICRAVNEQDEQDVPPSV